jgi:hypothetical protein
MAGKGAENTKEKSRQCFTFGGGAFKYKGGKPWECFEECVSMICM